MSIVHQIIVDFVNINLSNENINTGTGVSKEMVFSKIVSQNLFWHFYSNCCFLAKFLAFYDQDSLFRVRPRFFDQVGHETMDAYSANKHFFTKSCHRQTYQNYEQSRQKLGTILENEVS